MSVIRHRVINGHYEHQLKIFTITPLQMSIHVYVINLRNLRHSITSILESQYKMGVGI